MSHAVPISIVIPTWNAGEEFPAVLDAVLGQEVEGSFEILVIDSGSTDDTVATARRCGCRVLEIAKEDFDHGLTRQMGVREATGNLVVLMTQDARPADSRWLAVLVEPFSDPRVAGAYSAQEPRADASPFIRDRLLQWAAGSDQPRVQEVADPEAFAALPPLEKLSRVAFDNVSSCVRREVALRTPFRRRQFGEDLDWAHRAILEGHRVVFQPRSRVVHSHNRSRRSC